ncbi:prolyl oligopeptidase family serine peptidase [Sphingomonas naphthae]|uniref:prolyl oligopeptidase n=1 Tax=Sphingomonas naphthae TaxID=1813468 RepID=A0ABY7TJ58_9SPHN|nr:prolyl oligopeptidase family serine peptidase [Sphingomonas naphthae]WCT72975.1 prolyl oligopeptidase family serine peptidase [Sphingomonas naphthae]
MRPAASLIAIAMTLATPAFAQTYPATEKGPVVEDAFGQKVVDPYRWLENDVRTDARVKAWVDAEVATTNAYLETLPGRAAIAARLKQLWNYERVGVPAKRGANYFYTRNSGLQNQSPLYVRTGIGGAERLLIDPNLWAKDGATALAEWVPADDGGKLAYAVQDGGTDWRTVKFLDTATAQPIGEELKWVKFSALSWAHDGSGLYYSRFDEPASGQQFQATNENQKIFFHKLGTPQSADPLIYATPDRPKLGHGAQVTDDGKWLVIITHEGTDPRNEVTLLDLTKPGAKPVTIIKGIENNWSLVGNQGSKFWFVTDRDAPRQRIVMLDAAKPAVAPVTVVAEDKATLEDAGVVGDKLVASYLVDAKTEVRLFGFDGKPAGTVPLPGIGTAGGFGGKIGDPETFFSFTSFNVPTAIYRFDVKTGKATPFATPKVAFDPAAYEVKQQFYASKDGTRIPIFIVHKTGLDLKGGVPTVLYGYGGFNISVTPAFSPSALGWIDMGGVYAVANIRGGGEYGMAWHDGGRLARKQNVFDDFIAAGEYLIAQGITTKGKLAISGRSNGGLLVGAVTNQRPDLFAVALPGVGVMDMLRFDRFTAGRYWVDDYGYPSKEADWKVLRAYSPYHNVKSGVSYPAIMVTTADTDDRVVPGHSFKYAAAIQAADIGDKPHLIRIETRAGHGSGKPTDKQIAEWADLWAFTAKFTGLKVPEGM